MIFGSDVAGIGTISCKKQTVSHVVSGTEGFLLAEIARSGSSLVYISSDERSLLNLKKVLAFTVPEIKTFILPAWDCLPYDRVSPSPRVVASRLSCFSHLATRIKEKKISIILTTVSALMSRFLSPDVIENYRLLIRSGDQISMTKVIERLETNGFQRVDIVHAVGEYAVRGGIIDLYLPTKKHPIRLDFFGDNLESLRFFDSVSQRTIGNISSLVINALSEVILTPQTISLFRKNYLLNFGAVTQEDPLYVSISAGRRYPGVEHWLPFFYDNLETIFTYFADFCVVTDSTVKDAAQKHSQLIQDYYEARSQHPSIKDNTSVYKPILPEKLYLDYQQFSAMLENSRNLVTITPFNQQETEKNNVISLNARSGKSWIPSFSEKMELRDHSKSVGRFERLISYIADQNLKGKQVLISAFSEGSLQYLLKLLGEDGLEKTKRINVLEEMDFLVKGEVATTVLSLDTGFETKKILLITEKDIMGERIIRRSRRRKSVANAIFEATNIEEGTIIVHAEHGIGRFVHLRSLEVSGRLHDCLELHYDDDAKLFLPVENIDLISRYSTEDTSVALDKLGGVSWQARKAQLKKRLEDLAQQLIDIAAKRSLHQVPSLIVPQELYKKFLQRFPYVETEDQEKAIEAVLQDLSSGHPMDRLICGDVGFGKTEVVLRAAFVAAMNGLQVVVIAPTTLLVRQHLRVFSERFQDFAIRIASISRFVRAKEVSLCKQELAEGKIDIIIGTHALLNPAIKFSNLGLLIIDEEQHFGVKHKEKLKEIKTDIHVLTLSATPIPRTLQLAMTGVRELSLITTPPMDRIPCRTSISIFDPLVVRETLMREYYRGGQSFYVCPRLLDLEKCYDFLRSEVPELKIAIAHGKMPPRDLEKTMNSFYDGQYDVLLSTSIVESGLDFPRANTIIVHRADMFGLAQLYQLRGRVGRSKISSFAVLLLSENKLVTDSAQKRLKILSSFNTFGAGFQIANHDLDIRGTGNLLGEEQSGHIREVGFELYQKMLKETVSSIKEQKELVESDWSPQITIGASVMIPESYVADMNLRLSLYRRLGNISNPADINHFEAEIIDRFGPIPIEVVHLLKVVFLKLLCRIANVEKMDIGPKGIVVQFRDKKFHNPQALIDYIAQQKGKIVIRFDQSLIFYCSLSNLEKKFTEAKRIILQLTKLIDAEVDETSLELSQLLQSGIVHHDSKGGSA